MSTAKERAAAHIEAVIAAGQSIALVPGRGRDGRDGIMTSFYRSVPRPLDPETAALADSYSRDRKADNRALVAELIRRGWVQ
ncbi:MAG: hypothetical protein P0Y66_02480 [Candidatus Kaistia colombiensis]|nr:MAG: hypothetical protein P0Y66_02480 [Kaistia sp.]